MMCGSDKVAVHKQVSSGERSSSQRLVRLSINLELGTKREAGGLRQQEGINPFYFVGFENKPSGSFLLLPGSPPI